MGLMSFVLCAIQNIMRKYTSLIIAQISNANYFFTEELFRFIYLETNERMMQP